MNSGFDISSLTRNSPAGGSGTPPAFGPGGQHQLLLPNIGPAAGMPMMPGHHPAVAMAAAANNSLASSVNLSSIQSLVDPLQELPLPDETPQATRSRQRLCDDSQQQYHAINNQDLGEWHLLSE